MKTSFYKLVLIILLCSIFQACKEKEPIPAPGAEFGYNPQTTSFTAPSTVRFTNYSTNADTYYWTYPGGNSTDKDLILTFPSAGSYTITLKATGSGGTDAISKTCTFVSAVSNNPPTASFTYSPNQNLIAPAKITFTNTSKNADSYKWDFGDGTTSTELNPAKEFTKAGTYNVKLIASSKTASSESTINITVNTASPVDNTGTISFWTKTDLKVGKIAVTVNGVNQGNITQSHSNGITCGQGNVNAKFNAGTYAFKATGDDGTNWSGNLTFEKGVCKTQELTKSVDNSGTSNCDWSSANSCVKITKAVQGTRCGKSNSVEIEWQNICNSNIKVVRCFQKTDGTWSCLPDGTFDIGMKPNEKLSDFICEGTGKYKIYSMPIADFLKNKCSYPTQ